MKNQKRKMIYKLLKNIVIILVVLVCGYFIAKSVIKEKIVLIVGEKLNSEVTLGSVGLSLYPSGIMLKNLNISKEDNSGFQNKYKLNIIEIFPEVTTITESEVIINEIIIRNPEITYNLGEIGFGTVVGEIGKKSTGAIIGGVGAVLKNTIGRGVSLIGDGIEALSDDPESIVPAKPPVAKKQLFIKKLHIKNGKFISAEKILWLKKGEAVSFPDIELRDINSNSRKELLLNIKNIIKKSVLLVLNEQKEAHQ